MTRRAARTSWLALAIALVAGVTAAWLVNGYARGLERRAGANVAVVVANRAISAGTEFGELPPDALSLRRLPKSYMPPEAIGSIGELAARRAAVDLPRGSLITAAVAAIVVANGGYELRRGERAVSVEAVVSPDGARPAAGQTVDLLASGIGGAADTSLVLAGAEILAAGDADASVPAVARRFTLRVGASQAASVVRADTFARQLRLLVRP